MFHDTIIEIFVSKQKTFGIFNDMTKAFESLNYRILLQRHKETEIREVALKKIRFYLSERTQRICLTENEKMRSAYSLILGPLILFIQNTNDIANRLTVFFATRLADDISAIVQFKVLI